MIIIMGNMSRMKYDNCDRYIYQCIKVENVLTAIIEYFQHVDKSFIVFKII